MDLRAAQGRGRPRRDLVIVPIVLFYGHFAHMHMHTYTLVRLDAYLLLKLSRVRTCGHAAHGAARLPHPAAARAAGQ